VRSHRRLGVPAGPARFEEGQFSADLSCGARAERNVARGCAVFICMADTRTRPLSHELAEMAARAPAAVAARLASGLAEIAASGVAPGLQIGDRAPNFTLPDALGQRVELFHRLESGPVVLTFYRGAWCPYCNLTLRALQAALPRLRTHGASVIAISPQTPDRSLTLTEKHSLEFDVLSDVEQSVIRAYRVQFTSPADIKDLYLNTFHNDLSTQTADGSWALPIPATFVIDRTGIIRARHVRVDYRTRMDPDDIEAALSELGEIG
jgi:peroxiredoxin